MAFKVALIRLILPLRENILRILGRTDFDTIYFEGGLGSQLLSYIEFLKSPRKVDLTYFRNPPISYRLGPDVWKWELHQFGVQIDDLKEYENNTSFNPWITRRPSSKELYKEKFSESRLDNRSENLDLRNHFPIDYAQIKLITDKYNLNLATTIAIHVRRGDYERVASRLIEYGEYKKLLLSITTLVDYDLIVISDSNIPIGVQNDLVETFSKRKVVFLPNLEISAKGAHDLMRVSRILVTANSTFSISAGLLSLDETVVFSPIQFFGGENGYLNSRIFNSNGEFYLMRRHSKNE